MPFQEEEKKKLGEQNAQEEETDEEVDPYSAQGAVAEPDTGSGDEEVDPYKPITRGSSGPMGMMGAGLAKEMAGYVDTVRRLPTDPDARRALLEGAAVVAANMLPFKKIRVGMTLAELGLAGKLGVAGLRAVVSGTTAYGTSMLASETFDPVMDKNNRAKTDMILAMGAEVVPQFIMKAIKWPGGKITELLSKKSTPLAKRAQEFLQKEGGKEYGLTFSQARPSTLADAADNIMNGNPFSKAIIERKKNANNEVVQEYANLFVSKMSKEASPDEIFDIVDDAIKGGKESFKETAAAKFGLVDEVLGSKRVVKLTVKEIPDMKMVSNNPHTWTEEVRTETVENGVNISAMQEEAAKLLVQVQEGLGVNPGAESFLRRVINKDKIVTFSEAARMRSDALSIVRGGAEDQIPGLAKGVAKKAASGIDRSMAEAADKIEAALINIDKIGGQQVQTAAKKHGITGLDVWRDANSFYKGGVKKWNSNVVKSLMKAEPDLVADKIIGIKSPNQIRMLKDIVTDGGRHPTNWKPVEGHFLRKIFKDSIDPVTREIKGTTLVRKMAKSGVESEYRAAKQIVSPKVLKDFKEFGEVMELVQAKPRSDVLRMAAQFQVAGAITGGLIFSSPLLAGALLVTPVAMAKLTGKTRFLNTLTKANIAVMEGNKSQAQKLFGIAQRMALHFGAQYTSQVADPSVHTNRPEFGRAQGMQ